MASSKISSELRIDLVENATATAPRVAAALEKVQKEADALRAALARSSLPDRLQADLSKLGASAAGVEALGAKWSDYAKARGLAGKASVDWTKADAAAIKQFAADAIKAEKLVAKEEAAHARARHQQQQETVRAAKEAAAEEKRVREEALRETARAAREEAAEERRIQRELARERAREDRERLRAIEHQREAISRNGFGHFVATGAAAAVSAHGVIHGAEISIEKGAELQQTRAVMEKAGIDAATRKTIEDQALELSAKYGNISQIAIMELAKEARSVLKDQKEVGPTTAVLAAAKSALDANDPTGGSSDGLGMLVKGAESIGAAQDPERLAKLIESYVKAISVMGKTINPEQIYQFDKYLKAEGARVSDRFLMTTGLSLAQEMGGSTAGKDIAQTSKDIIGGFQNKHVSLKEAVRVGLIDRRDVEWVGSKNGKLEAKGIKAGHQGVKDADLAASDLDLWVYKDLLPALERTKGIGKDRVKQLDWLSKVFTGTEADVISKLITQRESFENHAKLYMQAKDLSENAQINHQLAAVGFDAMTKALANLEAQATSPAMGAAGRALFSIADGLNWLAVKAKDHPVAAVTGAGVTAAAGLGASGYLAYKMLNGFGLKGSASKLDHAALALEHAATKLSGVHAGDGTGPSEGLKGSKWAKTGKAIAAAPLIGETLNFGLTSGNAAAQVSEDVIARAQDAGLADRAAIAEMRARQKQLAEENAIWNDPSKGMFEKFMAGQRAEQLRRELDARGQSHDLAPIETYKDPRSTVRTAPVASPDDAGDDKPDTSAAPAGKPVPTPLAGARATGGPVASGRTYLVGEHGPELFTAGSTGQITSHERLMAAVRDPSPGELSTADVQRILAGAGASRDAETAKAVRGLSFNLTRAVDRVAEAVAEDRDLRGQPGQDGYDGGGTRAGGGSGYGAGGGGSGGNGGNASGGGSGVAPASQEPQSPQARVGLADRPVPSGREAFGLEGPKPQSTGIRPIDPGAFSGSVDGKPEAGPDVVGGPGFNTRGVKNKNPGNIGWGKWAKEHGAIGGAGADTGHQVAVFPNFTAGYAAMRDLAAQKYAGGAKSLDQLIAGPHGWTPGNHAAAANVAASMGIGPHDDAHLDRPEMMERFKRGLSKQELGPNGAKFALAKAAQEGGGSVKVAGAFGLGGFNMPPAPQRREGPDPAIAARSAPSDGAKIVGGANLMSGGHYPGARPGTDLVTITTQDGRRLTVHRDAAPSFKRFLDQLEGQGYKIHSLGGYAARGNRSDPSRLSEHAYGNAIDINPDTNPFRSDRTDMPPNISRMAAENGLSWGGDWRHRDNMHFEWRGVRPWLKDKSPDAVAAKPPDKPVGEAPTAADLNRANEQAYRSGQNPFLQGKRDPLGMRGGRDDHAGAAPQAGASIAPAVDNQHLQHTAALLDHIHGRMKDIHHLSAGAQRGNGGVGRVGMLNARLRGGFAHSGSQFG